MTTALILSIFAGWFGHKLKPFIATAFPLDGTNRLASYGIGALLIYLAFELMTSGRMDNKERETAKTQLLVAMLAVGLGTTAGTVSDYLRGA